MDEATLTRKLEASLNDSSLVLQVAFAVPYVQVVINRTQLPPDYPALSQRIAELLGQIGIPEMQYVAVYGRVYGQEDLEYETSLAIVAPAPTAPTPVSSSENPFLTAVTDTPAPSEPEPFNLAKYCFTRNRALLTADLPSPKIALAELLRDFDHLLDSEKQLILEQFSTFLRNPDGVNTANWSEEMRAWLGKVRNFGDEETRNMAIWLSRYCAHPETTLETVRGVIKAAKEAAKERARQEREARLAERQGRTTTASPLPQAKVVSPQSQRFSSDELPIMVVGSVLLAVIGWFLWGTSTVFFIFGWAIAIVSIVTGVISAGENQTAKLVGLILSLLLTIIAFVTGFIGFIVLWIDFLGWLTGYLATMMVLTTMKTSGATSIFAPKPLRLLIVISLVILMGFTYSIIDPPGDATFETKNLFQNKKINGFSIATCEQLIQRTENERFTIQNAIDLIGTGATSIESEIRAGRPGYVWNYDNARIVLLSDDISKEAVVDVVAVCMACEKTNTGGTVCQGRNLLGDFDFDK